MLINVELLLIRHSSLLRLPFINTSTNYKLFEKSVQTSQITHSSTNKGFVRLLKHVFLWKNSGLTIIVSNRRFFLPLICP